MIYSVSVFSTIDLLADGKSSNLRVLRFGFANNAVSIVTQTDTINNTQSDIAI